MKLLDAKSNYLTSKLNERFEISIVRAKLKTKRNIKRERQTNLYVEKKKKEKKKKKKEKSLFIFAKQIAVTPLLHRQCHVNDSATRVASQR